MRTVFIYALIDPRDNRIRYVGKADEPQQRLSSHVSGCRRENYRSSKWIRELLDLGLRPRLEILEPVEFEKWPEREKHWIRVMRDRGIALLNVADGGMGATGVRLTEEAKRKLGDARRRQGYAHMHTPEARAKTGAKLRGRPRPEHIREHLRRVKTGVPLSPWHKQSLREAKYRQFSDPKQRERLSRYWAKLTDEQVLEVWWLAVEGKLSQDEIGRRYGVCGSVVSEIKTGKRYAHVPRPVGDAFADPRRQRGDRTRERVTGLWKEGKDPTEIAAAVGLCPSAVCHILKFADCGYEPPKFRRARELKELAVRMRGEGKSYREIMEATGWTYSTTVSYFSRMRQAENERSQMVEPSHHEQDASGTEAANHRGIDSVRGEHEQID